MMSSQDTPEEELFALVREHSVAEPQGAVWDFGLKRHPRDLVRAVRLLPHLPRHAYHPSGSPVSKVLVGALDRRALGRRTPVHEVTNVLELPSEPGTFSLGRPRATLRRKVRAAQKLGVTWRRVEDHERRHLVELAEAFERANPRTLYRNEEPDTGDLLIFDHWLLAEVGDRPVLLSITAVDGEWSVLRYFRTLEDSDEASTARYMMTEALAETLAERGVTKLCDQVSPFRLPSGLLHFARMVGFRLMRVRVEA